MIDSLSPRYTRTCFLVVVGALQNLGGHGGERAHPFASQSGDSLRFEDAQAEVGYLDVIRLVDFLVLCWRPMDVSTMRNATRTEDANGEAKSAGTKREGKKPGEQSYHQIFQFEIPKEWEKEKTS